MKTALTLILTILLTLVGCGDSNSFETTRQFQSTNTPPDVCSVGSSQSPINIINPVVDKTLAPLALDSEPFQLHLINTGSTIEQELEGQISLQLHGSTYRALQFHFHTPSEHTLGGVVDLMEMHLVFERPSDGHLAVLALLYEDGAPDPFLQELIPSLPETTMEETESALTLDMNSAYPDLNSYYAYHGSLTTPPCFETVNWFVLKEKGQISPDQFAAFNDIMGNNARPPQPLNGRVVRCTPTNL